MNKQTSQSGGFALLLTLIISSVALAIGLSLLDITLKQLSLGTTARESETAFQMAATAMNCLQFARNTDLNRSQTNGANFSIDCVDVNFRFNDAHAASNIVYYTNGAGNDLNIDGTNRCVQYEMYVLLATTGIDVGTTNSAGDTIQCEGNSGPNVCTYAYARGYNRSCADVTVINSFVVQRELTAEF
jgi:hypothetical protein